MEARDGSRGSRNALCPCKVAESVTKKISAWEREKMKSEAQNS